MPGTKVNSKQRIITKKKKKLAHSRGYHQLFT